MCLRVDGWVVAGRVGRGVAHECVQGTAALPPNARASNPLAGRPLGVPPFTYQLLKPQPQPPPPPLPPQRGGYGGKAALLAELAAAPGGKFEPSPASPTDLPMHRVLALASLQICRGGGAKQ